MLGSYLLHVSEAGDKIGMALQNFGWYLKIALHALDVFENLAHTANMAVVARQCLDSFDIGLSFHVTAVLQPVDDGGFPGHGADVPGCAKQHQDG